MEELKILDEQEVLGKQFKIYGTAEEPLFIAKDVAEWIEYDTSSVNKMLANVDDDEKVRKNIPTLGGLQESWLLTEDGLYEVLMQSRKPIAKQFKKKVKEILKEIRKNGGYIAGQENLSDDELMEKAILVAQRRIAERDKIIQEQRERIAEQKPLVDFAVHVSQTKDTIDMDEMAKIARDEHIDIGRNKLIKWLKDKKILKDNRTPYQSYIDRGYFDVVEVEKSTTYGTKVFPKTVITGKGQIWITEKLRTEY